MAEYTSLIAMAQRLIKKKGQSVTWRQIENGHPGDPNKPWKVGSETFTDYTVDVAFLPPDRENKYFTEYMEGMTSKTGQTLAYMGQVSFTPKAKDVIIRNGIEYPVETIDPIEPNDEGVILYVFELGAGGAGN